MKTQTDTTSTTKSKAAANTISSRKDKGGAAVQIDDKRQQSGKITQLQEMANGSTGVAIQRVAEEEELMQGKFDPVQKMDQQLAVQQHATPHQIELMKEAKRKVALKTKEIAKENEVIKKMKK
jgi:hypothetical protein